ncbi:MAG: 2Fe-2S iron-sulfur cluster-binding protein [Corynebacterium sp.]|uniref:2Fe-2S iron-sulfur cluster-binding protein n=1 Tax=Corynebacterium sp. TaxID=1720 RepID=UPI0026E037A5|nr:2Fe-2S iron-sulfur cluster-binding protein [Corynebacterium sp.]MDO5670416.1 2Fe-2S iron-sulfur cluster-binding protein [Corynebacterium sp.]
MTHTADIDGTKYTFPWPADQTLLDALIAESIPAWYSCMEGHCGTCQCTLTGGPSHMLNNEVLSRYEITQENQTLACQTIRDGEGPYQVSYE